PCRPLRLCVGIEETPRDTRALVERVAAARTRDPARTDALLDRIGGLAAPVAPALGRGDPAEPGGLFGRGPQRPGGLGVRGAGVDRLCASARAAGARGAKLTGAGGGGAVLAVAGDREAAVLEAWRGAGATGFAVELACAP